VKKKERKKERKKEKEKSNIRFEEDPGFQM
jgi:hypothetical protein